MDPFSYDHSISQVRCTKKQKLICGTALICEKLEKQAIFGNNCDSSGKAPNEIGNT